MRIQRLVLFLQASAAVFLSSVESTGRPRVDGRVHRTLQRQGTANILVSMRDDTKSVLDSLPHEASFDSRGDMIADMVSKLESHAETSQAEIVKLLAQEDSAQLASEVRHFWISNQVYFRDATFELVEKLATIPGVASIEEEKMLPIPDVEDLNVTSSVGNPDSVSLSATNNQWGIDRIRVPEVWASGTSGAGIVVATIDTGVRGTHDILRGNFRREFGWFDPEAFQTDPYDSKGHGTHTMGTIAGSNGYGVAPGSQWIACKCSRGAEFSIADLLSCAQFITCPTDPTGTTQDCSKAPHLVSNSWSGEGGDSWYAAAVDAWRRAGIIPIFSSGNTGPECGTTRSPGDYSTVISVGSTDVNEALAKSSSRGPTLAGLTKPDLSGPGVAVASASWTSDSEYATKSGTSMSTPHVAGVIALLLSAEPSLTFDQVRQRLIETTEKWTLQAASPACGGTTNWVYPNNMYGHGRVDAMAAMKIEPGRCDGLAFSVCGARFFCTWSSVKQNCQRWWT